MAWLGIMAVLLMWAAPNAYAQSTNNIGFTVGSQAYSVNGQFFKMDAVPFVQQGRVYVPIRYLAEPLGINVSWDNFQQSAVLQSADLTVILTVGSQFLYRNGQAERMDVAPVIRDGRTYLPARYVAEAFGYQVGWDPSVHLVSISADDNGFSYTATCSDVDEDNLSAVGTSDSFSPDASRIYAFARLNRPLTGIISANWYSVSPGGSRTLMATAVNESRGNDVFWFWIEHNVITSGNWEVELTTGGARTTLYFAIEDPARDLADAIDNGDISIWGEGCGLTYLTIGLASHRNAPVTVDITPGMIFDSRSSQVQDMVVLEDVEVYLEPHEEATLDVRAACVNMIKDMPEEGDGFTYEEDASGDLERLLNSPGFADEGIRITQFAIWTITDNPDENGYAAIILERNGVVISDSGPSDSELNQIKRLFIEAGIDPDDYRAFD